MMNICPVCGKYTCIHWPEHWIYRRGSTYYCSENCLQIDLFRDMNMMNQVMRKRRGNNIMRKITLEQKKKAVEIAISGESPLPFLKQCWSAAPDKTWYAIKAALKETDLETYEKIPDFRKKSDEPKTAAEAMTGMKNAADEFFGKCEAMGLKTITDEDVEAKLPEVDLTIKSEDLFTEEEREFEKRTTVTAIRVEGLGEFYFDKKFKAIDWRTEGGDEVSLGPAWWLQLAEDLPLILTKLGVES